MSARPQELATITGETQALARRVGTLHTRCLALEVSDREEFQAAAETLRSVKALQKALEEARTSVTAPLNQALRQVNEWFRGPAAELTEAERHIKTVMGAFEREERARAEAERRRNEERARAEQEELRRRAAAAERKGQEEKAATLAARAESIVPKAPEMAPVKARGMSFGTVWKARIVDPQAVPRAYCTPDVALINATVKATKGQVKIEGVEVYEENAVRAGT